MLGASVQAFAEPYRIVINGKNGLELCEYDDGYSNCTTANLRHKSYINGEVMSCTYDGGEETDCLPYEDHYDPDWVMNHSEDEDIHYFRPYRVVVNDKNGLQVCEYGPGYTNCTTANLRHKSYIGGEVMSCIYDGGEEADCLPYEDHFDPDWVMNHRDDDESSSSQSQSNQSSSNSQSSSSSQSSSQSTSSSSSSYHYHYDEPTYWENDFGIPNGVTWGIKLGWFGHVSDSKLVENSFSFGGEIGGKWTHFGFLVDCDASIKAMEQIYHDFWTYSVHALFMIYLPTTYEREFTLGFGIGYSGWSLDYEYSERPIDYNWYSDVYADHIAEGNPVKKGDFLSLKLKARYDFVFEDMVIGFEFDWIPWLDVKRGGKLVNNLIGLQFYFGGIQIIEQN